MYNETKVLNQFCAPSILKIKGNLSNFKNDTLPKCRFFIVINFQRHLLAFGLISFAKKQHEKE
jgi:hypothetical protein